MVTNALQKLLVGVLLMIPAIVHGAMAIDQNIFHFEPGQPPRADVQVINPDVDPMYVQVEVLEVVDPGTPYEERRLIDNPRHVNFLVTPNRFIVPAKSRKVVRLVNLGGHGEEERIFRVNLKPVPPPMQATKTGVRILVAHQLLVVVAPQEAVSQVVATREGDGLKLENQGNTNVLLRGGRQCATEADLRSGSADSCVNVDTKRLYPGNVWELADNGPVEFVVMQGEDSVRQRF